MTIHGINLQVLGEFVRLQGLFCRMEVILSINSSKESCKIVASLAYRGRRQGVKGG